MPQVAQAVGDPEAVVRFFGNLERLQFVFQCFVQVVQGGVGVAQIVHQAADNGGIGGRVAERQGLVEIFDRLPGFVQGIEGGADIAEVVDDPGYIFEGFVELKRLEVVLQRFGMVGDGGVHKADIVVIPRDQPLVVEAQGEPQGLPVAFQGFVVLQKEVVSGALAGQRQGQ